MRRKSIGFKNNIRNRLFCGGSGYFETPRSENVVRARIAFLAARRFKFESPYLRIRNLLLPKTIVLILPTRL